MRGRINRDGDGGDLEVMLGGMKVGAVYFLLFVKTLPGYLFI
jgi:hypothetical protein